MIVMRRRSTYCKSVCPHIGYNPTTRIPNSSSVLCDEKAVLIITIAIMVMIRTSG